VQINGQVNAEAVPALHDRVSEVPEVSTLRERLAELGATLDPTHEGVDDPSLALFFTVDLPDDEELLERVLEILHESPAVDAAYVKPADEPP
jgi:hypothetical protein